MLTVVLVSSCTSSSRIVAKESNEPIWSRSRYVHLVLICDTTKKLCPDITKNKIKRVDKYLSDAFQEDYQFKLHRIFLPKSHLNPDLMLKASEIYRSKMSIHEETYVGFVSLESDDFAGWAGLFEGHNSFFISLENNTHPEKTLAHEISHLKLLKHTCDVTILPDMKDLTPYIMEVKKCNDTREYLMHPASCPDVDRLEDCKIDINYKFTDEEHEKYSNHGGR